jgi:hypothetical protein
LDEHDDIRVVAPPSLLPANGVPQTPQQQPATSRCHKSGSTTPVHQTPGVTWPSPYPAGGASKVAINFLIHFLFWILQRFTTHPHLSIHNQIFILKL